MTTGATLLGSDEPLQTAYDVALLDLDGVVYRGAFGVAGAPEAVTAARAAGMRVMYVTNNAARAPQTVADHLTELEIPTSAQEVTTAAQAAAALVASEAHPGTRVLTIGGEGLRLAMAAEGLTVVDSADDAPTIVVQGFAPTLGWRDLAEAVYAIRAGADYIASNLDATLPTDRGMAPGNGALVAAVVHATGVTPRSTGKPQASIFHQAARRSEARNPLVVGDRLNTDIAGARAAGYPSLHVLTGVDQITDVLRAVPGERPTFLAADLAGLARTHPLPEWHGGAWTCGTAAARVEGTTLVLTRTDGEVALGGGSDPTEVSLDEFRAATAAAWTATDAVGPDHPRSGDAGGSVLPADFPPLRLASE
ncbi:HAD-IIA family hydrolase [Occultella glacieicola]|uniref:HAD-IIA family hydrolase n=1 Tax=Occultella glacieicola TaxID=2518684 RepID=A0ABY2DZH8_9MICO|nr:HAD-IIA family hydrolase [Occultella glacieicola]TDE90285.1 HAD-IIA family hydrolase [Occultella glacieicola]